MSAPATGCYLDCEDYPDCTCGKRDESSAAYGPGLCAHTEFECDCDCDCPKGKLTVECGWPDCADSGCGCLPSCVGCSYVREQEEVNYG